jgi:hypothetical protein
VWRQRRKSCEARILHVVPVTWVRSSV